MGRKNRGDVIDESEVGVYQIVSSCVRQKFLCGLDWRTGRDYSYRRNWFLELLEHLLTVFAIDASAFAVLMNHFHLILRNRPDLAESWSEEEVAVRWWRIWDSRAKEDPTARPKEVVLQRMLADPQRIGELRRRLASPSWFMKELKQPIARRANREDGVRGHFFAERFGAIRLADELDVVAANIYVDLNEIRAGIASSLEDSRYSSAHRRLSRLKKAEQLLLEGDPEQAEYYAPNDPDFWLAPVFERGEAPALFALGDAAWPEYPSAETADAAEASDRDAGSGSGRKTRRAGNAQRKRARERKRRGFLPMTLKAYLQLLDEVGRQTAAGKRGVIDPSLPPLLERLSRQSKFTFNDRIQQLYRRYAALERPHPDDAPASEAGPPHPTPSVEAPEGGDSRAAKPANRSARGRDPTGFG